MVTAFRKSLYWIAGCAYRIPHIGIRLRKFTEARLGTRYYQNRDYWNQSLQGWASSYLGGTLNIDLRNAITMLLAHRFVPTATSILDLGCAGGSLSLCLGPEFQHYCGVDISDVAIAKARELIVSGKPNSPTNYQLEPANVQEFVPPRKFDIIVFNEVLYYLSLDHVAATISRYSGFLRPNGLVVISLKEDALSSLVQSIVSKKLKFEYGVLYQHKLESPGWKTTRNRETPAFLVQAFRAES